jgi:hypothetical protein
VEEATERYSVMDLDRHSADPKSLVREAHANVTCSNCGVVFEVLGATQGGQDRLLCAKCVAALRRPVKPTTP